MTIIKNTKRFGLLLALTAAFTLQLLGVSSAFAAATWRLTSLSNTTVQPGGELIYHVELGNVGDAPTDGTDVNLTVTLPAGVTGVSADPNGSNGIGQFGPFDCPTVAGATGTFTCTGQPSMSPTGAGVLLIRVAVDDLPTDTVLTTAFILDGGGASNIASTVDPVIVSPTEPLFGFDAFDVASTKGGLPYTQAAGHPDELTTSIDFPTHTDPSPMVRDVWPIEDVKDVRVELPPGLVGNPTGLAQCTQAELANGEFQPAPLCPTNAQVGVVSVRHGNGVIASVPVYNMVPPPNVPARFAFNVNATIVVLDAHVRTGGDYGIGVTASNVPQGLAIVGNTFTLWGFPGDDSHRPERGCPGQAYPSAGGGTCDSGLGRKAFFRNPTSCSAPGQITTTIEADSWQHQGTFVSRTIAPHLPPGYPFAPDDWGLPLGVDGCDAVPFDPRLDAQPLAGSKAGSPAGFAFDLSLPQDVDKDVPASQADLRKVTVTLPLGVRVNPSSADGLGACTSDQIALRNASQPTCPDNSKLGSVTIDTPLLDVPVTGNIYLAKPFDNPFNSLIAVYIVASAKGVVIKLPGLAVMDPNTGQISTTFDNNPQLPFRSIHLELKGGPRAALTLPNECGTHTTKSTFTGWNTRTVQGQSSFTVNEGCENGFSPALNAGVDNPIAGEQSPFALQVKRDDADQELRTLDTTLPQGLSAVLKGISPCPESALASFPNPPIAGQGAAELANSSCPAASQVGRVIVGAGAGSNPFYVDTGKAYLAGPYKGAPLSLAFVTPAVAGPFDLGNVLVRAAAHVDPVTAQVTAKADPLPQALSGIPLDIRDIRVQMDRPNFTLNPTSCEEMSVDASLTSTQGATANPRDRFQLAECSSLGFKPKLTLRLRGRTNRGAHPALTAILKPRRGDANISKVSVALPKSEFLDQAHLNNICTRAQFAASECPAGAIYGHATVTTPLFDEPLTGPVYLRSSRNLLPDLVPDLRGPDNLPIRIESAGRIDEVDGGIRNTFDFVPDAPFTKLVMRLKGGNKGLLQNSRNICRQAFRATVKMDAHNGKIHDFKPVLKASCGGKKGKAQRGKHNKGA